MDLAAQVAAAPDQPGVYLFRDALGTIIYVGKANSLRHRLKSYFLDSRIADAPPFAPSSTPGKDSR